MRITIDKGILILLYDTFCNTFDDNNRSVSSGFVRFRGKGLPAAGKMWMSTLKMFKPKARFSVSFRVRISIRVRISDALPRHFSDHKVT